MTIMISDKQIAVKKSMIIVGILVFLLIMAAAGIIISRNNAGIIIDKREAAASGRQEASQDLKALPLESKVQSADGARLTDDIKVYVVGCVKEPGIVTLKKGQIIDDAIKAAGGAGSDADLENINLVYKLRENVMLRIKPKKEVQAAAAPGMQAQENSGEAGPGIEISRDSGGTIVFDNAGQSNGSARININTATLEKLDSLPGIGTGAAKDIIAYREKNGEFKSTTDIMKVPGIKESKFGRIKDLITVD